MLRMILLVAVLMWSALPAQAGEVPLTIPDAFFNSQRAIDLCIHFANQHDVDSMPTRDECLEAIIKMELISLAESLTLSTAHAAARIDAAAEGNVIRSQWGEVLDLKICGDAEADVGEECDDGGILNGDGCTSNCIIEFCGDTVVNNADPNGNPTEQCDPPQALVCDSSCQTLP